MAYEEDEFPVGYDFAGAMKKSNVDTKCECSHARKHHVGGHRKDGKVGACLACNCQQYQEKNKGEQ